MLNSFPVAITVGLLLGTLSGMGVGGGSLLMLWLTAVLGFPHPDAKITNLLFFLPSAMVSTFIHTRKQHIKLEDLIPGAVTGCICTIVATGLSESIPEGKLKKLYGILLLIIGIKELFYRPRKAK